MGLRAKKGSAKFWIPKTPPVSGSRAAAPGDVAQDLGGGDGDDGQVVRPEPQRGDAEEQAQHHGGADAHEQPQPQRAALVHRHGGAVGPHQHERHLPEVEQAGVAEVHVEPHRGQGVGGGGDADGGPQRVGEDLYEVHAAPPRAGGSSDPLLDAEDALRPDHEHQDQDGQGDHHLELHRQPEGAGLGGHADDEAAHGGAIGGADPAEDDGGEHGEQQHEAHVPLHRLGGSQEDAGEAGQGRAEGPGVEDHPVDADAGSLGQVLVVGHGPHGGAQAGVAQNEADGGEGAQGGEGDDQVLGRHRHRPQRDLGLDGVLPVGERGPADQDEVDVPHQQ